MGVGGIESGMTASSVRNITTKTATPVVPEITGVQSVTAAADNFARVAQTSEKQQRSSEDTSGQEQLFDEGIPIQEVSKEKVENAIRDINAKIRPTHTECQFSYHEATKRISIKVLDQASGEVIREIPPEKTLDMIAKTLELAGILVDEKR